MVCYCSRQYSIKGSMKMAEDRSIVAVGWRDVKLKYVDILDTP